MSHINKPALDERQLERYVGSLLSHQPLRQAPSGLEARVLQELELQASRPWWLQSYRRWPWSARVLFLPLALALVQLSILATGRLVALWQSLESSAPASTAQSALLTLTNLSHAVQTLGSLLTRQISPAWLYGGVGLALLLYAALFGLGAAAFRTLLVTSEPVRYPT